jgi:hypothetical protein
VTKIIIIIFRLRIADKVLDTVRGQDIAKFSLLCRESRELIGWECLEMSVLDAPYDLTLEIHQSDDTGHLRGI